MVALTLRGTKGSPLTNTEMDNNLTALNIGKVDVSDIIDIAHGGTNASTLSQAKINLGIEDPIPLIIALS